MPAYALKRGRDSSRGGGWCSRRRIIQDPKEGEALCRGGIVPACDTSAIHNVAISVVIEGIGAAIFLVYAIHLKRDATWKGCGPGNGGCIEVFGTAMTVGAWCGVPDNGLPTALEKGRGIRALTEVLAAHVQFFVLFGGVFKEVGADRFGAEGF